MSELRARFGKRLRRLRRIADLTQEQLAEKVGVSADFISQVERGINTPSFDTIQKLAEVLEVDASELFLPSDKS
jgi:transcriptional regulator with XRE-family HTH domain